MTLSIIETLKERFLVVKDNKNKKWNVFDLVNKSFLLDWCNFIGFNEISDYLIIKQNKKSAIYHLEKGFVSQWFNYNISLENYSGNVYPNLLCKLFDKGYLIALRPRDREYFEEAFFNFDGKQVSDWFYDIRFIKVDNDDVLYVAVSKDNNESLFSLKKGKILDIVNSFYYSNEFFDFVLGRRNFYLAKESDNYLIINRNNEIVVRAKDINPILKEKYNKNNDSIYIVKNEKEQKAIFYNGYLTEYYDFILPISLNLIFLTYCYEGKNKKIYLLDLKNKTKIHFPILLFNDIEEMSIYLNIDMVKTYFEGFDTACSVMKRHKSVVDLWEEYLCLNCNNIV